MLQEFNDTLHYMNIKKNYVFNQIVIIITIIERYLIKFQSPIFPPFLGDNNLFGYKIVTSYDRIKIYRDHLEIVKEYGRETFAIRLLRLFRTKQSGEEITRI